MELHDAREMLVALLPRLRRLAAALTGSLERGDELVAATLRRVQESLGSWPGGMRFDSWVFRILHGLSATPERRARQGEGVSWRPDDRMVLHNARVAVADLPEMQRLVVALADVEGLTYDEAAKTLEIPRADLAVYLARGRAALAEALDLSLPPRPGKRSAGPPDELLVSLADGELAPKRQGEIQAELEVAPDLQARSRALREAGALAEEAFQDILQEDLPGWLEAELSAAAPTEEPPEAVWMPQPRVRRGPSGLPVKRVTAVVAVAAALLVIGVIAVAGPRFGGAGLDVEAVTNASATGVLERPLSVALDREVSAREHRISGGRLRIFVSFADIAGRPCRYYEAIERGAAQGVIGIACREEAAWRNVLALAAEGNNLDDLKPDAGGTARLEFELDRLMQGDPFSAEREERLIRTGWPSD